MNFVAETKDLTKFLLAILDFHDGKIFTQMPKISLMQPQEGVLNLLLISRWILVSKRFSTRVHSSFQKNFTKLS